MIVWRKAAPRSAFRQPKASYHAATRIDCSSWSWFAVINRKAHESVNELIAGADTIEGLSAVLGNSRPRRPKMENVTMSNGSIAIGNVAVAALLEKTSPSLMDSPSGGIVSVVGMMIVSILGISLALLILFYCGLNLFGFLATGPAALSYAALWMSSIAIQTGRVVAGSVYAILQSIAMGGVGVIVVLYHIVALVALVVGVFELLYLWSSGTLYIPAWLAHSWNFATDWVLYAWNSGEVFGWWHAAVAWLLQVWHSATDWVHHLWDSLPDHQKWKILYT